MKDLITKLKEIETIVEHNVGKELTEETAIDIYRIKNELMGKVKKLQHCDSMDEISDYIIMVLNHSNLQRYNWKSEAIETLQLTIDKLKGNF